MPRRFADRAQILRLWAATDLTITDLAERLGLDHSTVSKQLKRARVEMGPLRGDDRQRPYEQMTPQLGQLRSRQYWNMRKALSGSERD